MQHTTNKSNNHFVAVALPLPIDKEFIYRVSEIFSGYVSIGKRLVVPFGKRVLNGYAVGFPKESALQGIKDIKDIIDIADEVPVFDENKLKFYRWMSHYYFSPLGEILNLIHPPQAGKRSFAVTDAGAGFLQENMETAEAGLLKFIAAKKSVSLKAISKSSLNKSPQLIILKLKEKGLIAEVLKSKGKDDTNALRQEDIACQEALLHKPNTAQLHAIEKIAQGIESQRFSPFLLYGVTGSGKTLVYIKALEKAVAMGRRGIMLVPEIALTYGIGRYLMQRFGERLAVIHSKLSVQERYKQWGKIRSGGIDVVFGARSSLFAPLDNIGIIIIDEEHDGSYKQEEGVRYNARDSGLMLAKILNIAIVLGSATPSVETFYNAGTGKLSLLSINKRVEERPLPPIEVVDMKGMEQRQAANRVPVRKDCGGQKKDKEIISERLKCLIEEAVQKKQQSVVFLNRRGFANFLICKDCGHIIKCKNCSVSLTHHKMEKVLKCHYCDMSAAVPDLCPICSGCNIKNIGIGTEKVENELARLFPLAKITRMDRDTTRKRYAHEKILKSIASGEADILIGTQMIAKGHDFPNVTAAGIVSADIMMNIPDFRSAERTFQIITQVAGRTGRGNFKGSVIVQTYNPEHYCFKSILSHDYVKFFEDEIKIREELHYPPFFKLINIRLEGGREKKVIEGAEVLKGIGCKLAKGFGSNILLLGPTPAFHKLLRGKHRWHMLVKGKDVKTLHAFVGSLIAEFKQQKILGIELLVDVDPMTAM